MAGTVPNETRVRKMNWISSVFSFVLLSRKKFSMRWFFLKSPCTVAAHTTKTGCYSLKAKNRAFAKISYGTLYLVLTNYKILQWYGLGWSIVINCFLLENLERKKHQFSSFSTCEILLQFCILEIGLESLIHLFGVGCFLAGCCPSAGNAQI